jgi:hypothetical protein
VSPRCSTPCSLPTTKTRRAAAHPVVAAMATALVTLVGCTTEITPPSFDPGARAVTGEDGDIVGDVGDGGAVDGPGSDDVVALTERLLQLSQRYAAADDLDRAELLLSLQEVALRRRIVLETLAGSDVDAFLRASIPPDVRGGLPGAILGDVEEDATVVGTLRILCALQVEAEVHRQSCSRHLMLPDQTLLDLQLRDPPSWMRTGDAASAVGLRLGNTLVLHERDDIAPMMGTFHLAAAGGLPTTGEQRTLVLLVNYADDRSEPVTVAQLQTAVFTQTDAFFRENSYGQTFLAGEVHGWFPLAINRGSVDPFTEAELAEQQAIAAGIDVASFSRIVLYQTSGPNSASGGFAGLGTVGGNPSYSWLTGVPAVALIAHELGHNFGLMHANRFECGAGVVVSPTCPVVEYGDPYDTMGQSFTINGFPSPHFNAFHKERLGWLGTAASPPVTEVIASGTFTLQTMSLPQSSSPRALRVLRSTNATTGERTFLYVEHRARVGFDATLQNGRNASGQIVPLAFEDGVLLHLGQSLTVDSSRLLDTSPTDANTATAGADMVDVAVHVGQTFTDPATGIQIAVVSADANQATVTVTLSSTPPPCVRAAPLVSIAPSSQTTTAGTAISYTASITNLDSGACAARTFNLTTTQPAPATLDPIAPSATLAAGQATTLTLRASVPAGAAATTATLGLTATPSDNAAQAASGTATLVVIDPTNVCARSFPSVSVAPASQSGTAGSTLTWQLTVVNRDSAACPASTFNVASTLPTGFSATASTPALSLAAGATGTAAMAVTSGSTLAAGNYNLSFRIVRTFDNTTATSTVGVVYAVTVPPPPSCVRALPTISISPTSQIGPAGGTLAYSVRVDNRDSSGCAAATFSLTPTLPAGFSSTYAPSSLTLSPGTQATTTWSVTSPAQAPGQLFTLTTTTRSSADATLVASASASYGVNTTLTVTAATDKAAYAAGETVRITVRAATGATPTVGAAVTVRLTDPRARVSSFTGTTNANGEALITVNLGRRARAGTWSVAATASASISTGSASTSFVVR